MSFRSNRASPEKVSFRSRQLILCRIAQSARLKTIYLKLTTATGGDSLQFKAISIITKPGRVQHVNVRTNS